MSNAQGLPITTMVLALIVVLVLAGVSIFFFTSFQEGKESAEKFDCDQMCKKIQSDAERSGFSWYKLKYTEDDSKVGSPLNDRQESQIKEYCDSCPDDICCFKFYRAYRCIGNGEYINCDGYNGLKSEPTS